MSKVRAVTRPLAFGASLVGIGVLLIAEGLRSDWPPAADQVARWVYAFAAAACLLDLALSVPPPRELRDDARAAAVKLVLAALAALLLATGRPAAAMGLLAARELLLAVRAVGRATIVRRWLHALEARPMRMITLSFLAAIAAGTALLSVPAASRGDAAAPFVDALFTATSAVCVTGLVVRSTPYDWSPFGQGVILALIQVGGLGIMALSVSVVMLLGRRVRVRQRAALSQALDVATMSGLRANLRYLVYVTLVFEALGTVLLAARFAVDDPSRGRALWYGLFHAVSAWNNAGFALWDDSLTGYGSDPVVVGTVALLIVAGGLGFAVLGQLGSRELWGGGARRGVRRLSTHTKLVLITSAALLVGGTLAIFFVEFDRGLAGRTAGEKLAAAAFQSISARTAGFNTVDLAAFSPLGLLLVIVLMYVGASPGSTGGGIKTSTLAVLLLAVRALVLRRGDVEVFRRRISELVVLRVLGIVVVSVVAVTLFFTLLLAAEPDQPFEWLLFETVSAFGTVGYSTGITPQLGAPAKLLLTALMFIGRIGPLTLTLAIGRPRGGVDVQYPEAQVAVG